MERKLGPAGAPVGIWARPEEEVVVFPPLSLGWAASTEVEREGAL